MTRRLITPRRLGILSIAILVGLAAGFLVLKTVRPKVLPLPMDRCETRRFDPAAWKDSVRAFSATAVRGCMVDDLLASLPLKGMPQESIIAVLGPPTATRYFTDHDLVYWLGPERAVLSIDSEWLVIDFDSTGTVAAARVVTD